MNFFKNLAQFIGVLGASTALAFPAVSQDSVSAALVNKISFEPEATFGFRNGSLIAAPIPIADPTIGNGLVGVVGYLFNTDEHSDASYLGFGVLKTDGGSLGYGISGQIFLDSNRWKFGLTAGRVDMYYDLFVLGIPVPINQTGELANITAAYGLTSNFSIGTDVRYINTDIDPATPLPPIFDDFLSLEILNIGLTVDWDRRDDTIYPTSGTNLSFIASRGYILQGQAHDYEKAIVKFDAYTPVYGDNVIALRAAVCASSPDAPFFDSCALGSVDSFRGFPVTQFIDRRLLSFQAAWRGKFSKRFGYSIFGGVGAVGSSFSSSMLDDLKSAIGVGGRYQLSKKFPLTFSIDATLNDDGDKLLYVYLGQRF